MRSVQKWGLALVIGALASPASAQIITTSIPKGLDGAAADKTAAFHVMVSPFAKWKYGEVYLDPTDVAGTIEGTPNSDFMIAAEAAFGNPDGINFALGGWYNKIGTNDFDFIGFDVVGVANFASITATIETDLTVYEGHGAIFYKNLGLQVGMVKTSADFVGGNIVSVNGAPFSAPFTLADKSGDTTDWDAFLVYKHGLSAGTNMPLSLSVGAGAYRKAGEESSPIREADAKTVPTAFASASLGLFKGFGVDASFWYIGSSDATEGLAGTEFASDSQTRFTIGIGYSF